MNATNWSKARYGVERKCTCTKGNRSPECAEGWHLVDGFDTACDALKDAATLGFDMYRVIDSNTGRLVTY